MATTMNLNVPKDATNATTGGIELACRRLEAARLYAAAEEAAEYGLSPDYWQEAESAVEDWFLAVDR